MITCKLEPLTKDTDVSLRAWLSQDPYRTLVRVIESKVKRYESEALAEALQANPNNVKSEAFEAIMMKARRYANCLEVLKEIRETPLTHVFEIARLT